MEEASGGDLIDTIRKQTRLSESLAGKWIRQLSDGIEYCHGRGVVHRDLKCENLLLDSRVCFHKMRYCAVSIFNPKMVDLVNSACQISVH